jgi:hypothetical protein
LLLPPPSIASRGNAVAISGEKAIFQERFD